MRKTNLMLAVWFFCLIFLLTGCMRVGRSFPEDRVGEIKIGVTNKEDIRRIFGEPWRLGMEDGQQTWTYGNYRYTAMGTKETSDLVVRFTKDGAVASYSYNTSTD